MRSTVFRVARGAGFSALLAAVVLMFTVSGGPVPSFAASSPEKILIPKNSVVFTDPEKRWAMSIPARVWVPIENPGFSGTFWSTSKIENEFAANVGVIVEDLPRAMSLDDYIALSEKNAPRMLKNYKLIQKSVTARTVGGSIGRMDYTASVQGELHFLAYFAVRGRRAVIATYTSTAAGYPSTVASIEPYLRTLLVR
jgi:hypothetical protein